MRGGSVSTWRQPGPPEAGAPAWLPHEEDAQAALNDVLHNVGKRTFVATDRITVAESLGEW